MFQDIFGTIAARDPLLYACFLHRPSLQLLVVLPQRVQTLWGHPQSIGPSAVYGPIRSLGRHPQSVFMLDGLFGRVNGF